MAKEWTEQEIQYLINNRTCLKNIEIAKNLNRSLASVNHKIARLDLDNKVIWSEDDTKFLVDNYQNMNNAVIAKKLGFTETAVAHKANRMGITRDKSCVRKYQCNDNYFDNFSHNMAYILGFITADGYLYRNRYTSGKKSNTICIKLQARDIEILEFIKTELEYSGEICTDIAKNNGRSYVSIRINSKQCADKLESLGIIQCKSGKEKFPDIPQEFLYTYILGLFDGDGCIYFNEIKETYCFSIVCLNKQYLEDVQKFTGLGKVREVSRNHLSKQTLHIFRVTKKEELKVLYQKLYENAEFKLNRKYSKFTNTINFIKNRVNKLVKYKHLENDILLYREKDFSFKQINERFGVSKTQYYRIIKGSK